MMAHHNNLQPENWDELLPQDLRPTWEAWCQTLPVVTMLKVAHCYATIPFKEVSQQELHIFCDAFNEVIGAVFCLRTNIMEMSKSPWEGKASSWPCHYCSPSWTVCHSARSWNGETSANFIAGWLLDFVLCLPNDYVFHTVVKCRNQNHKHDIHCHWHVFHCSGSSSNFSYKCQICLGTLCWGCLLPGETTWHIYQF